MKNVFKMEGMGAVNDYLGVKIHQQDNKIVLTQPQLIKQIIKDMRLPKGTKTFQVPAIVTKILTRIPDKLLQKPKLFDYRSIVGKLNYSEKATRPKFAYEVH